MSTSKRIGVAVWAVRSVAVVAVVGSAAGSLLMFVIGAASTYDAWDTFLSGEQDKAGHVGVDATTELVTALDEFLFGLVLLYFAFGIFTLFVVRRPDEWRAEAADNGLPHWMQVSSLGELKTKLLEVIIVLFAVSFLKVALESTQDLEWTILVIPVAMVATAVVIYLLRVSETE